MAKMSRQEALRAYDQAVRDMERAQAAAGGNRAAKAEAFRQASAKVKELRADQRGR